MSNNEQNWQHWRAKEAELVELERQREELKEQIAELKEQIKTTSNKIHILKVGINQHNKFHKERKIQTNSVVYQMYGKPLNQLTEEEFKEYYRIRQRINRQKRKEKKAN